MPRRGSAKSLHPSPLPCRGEHRRHGDLERALGRRVGLGRRSHGGVNGRGSRQWFGLFLLPARELFQPGRLL